MPKTTPRPRPLPLLVLIHGSKLVLRIFAILLPFIGYALWKAFLAVMRSQPSEQEEPTRLYPYESSYPDPSDISHSQYELYHGDDK